MDTDDAALLKKLLTEVRVLSAGVLVDGAPYVGLLPFALSKDFSTAYVHVSQLARHSKGLGTGAAFSALIHAPDDPASDPLQVPRLTLNGVAEVQERGSPGRETGKAAFLARFPDSEITFELGDFDLVALRIRDGRYVVGFANARNVSPADLRAAAAA